jgi:hypothetical protein
MYTRTSSYNLCKFSADVIACDDETVLGGLSRFAVGVIEAAFSDSTAGLVLTTSIAF